MDDNQCGKKSYSKKDALTAKNLDERLLLYYCHTGGSRPMRDLLIRFFRVIRGLLAVLFPGGVARRQKRFEQDLAEWDALASGQVSAKKPERYQWMKTDMLLSEWKLLDCTSGRYIATVYKNGGVYCAGHSEYRSLQLAKDAAERELPTR